MELARSLIGTLIATGWRRLALVLLGIWEIYWFVEWREARTMAERLAKEAFEAPIYWADDPAFDLAMAQSELAFRMMVASPVVALAMFFLVNWIVAGFRGNSR